jgi:hypothetical protein
MNTIIHPVYSFYGRHYASFDPDLRSKSTDDGVDSWRLPDYSLVDFHIRSSIEFSKNPVRHAIFDVHLFNLLNRNNYITDATDGATHTGADALVFFGPPRRWAISLSIEL